MALNIGGSKSLFWKTGIDNTGLKQDAKESKAIIANLAGSVSKLDVFAGLAISAGLAFQKISKAAYKFSKDFQTAMKEVQTISVAVQNNYAEMSEQIMSMSKRVPELSNTLAKAYYQIVSAGYDGAKGMELLEVSSKLAVAGVTDTFTVADTLTSIMNAYGDKAGTAAEISDKLFTVVKLGKVNMTQLAGGLSQVTGLAAQAGLEFNDLMAIVAKGTKTMQPEQMITGVRGILNAIIKGPLDKAGEVVKELGIDFNLSSLQAKGFAGFMAELMEKTQGNIETLQKLFPDVQGLAGFLAVAAEEGGNFNDVLKEVDNSLGATDKAFKAMVNTTENQTKILMNIINSKLKPFGDSILESVNSVAGAINKAFTDVVKETNASLISERVQFEKNVNLLEVLMDKTDKTKDEKELLKKAIDSLQSVYPEYLSNIDSEKTKYTDLKIAIQNTRIALIEKAKIELLMARQQELINDVAEAELKRMNIIDNIAKKEAEYSIEEENRLKRIEEVNKKWTEFWANNPSIRNAAVMTEAGLAMERASEYSVKQLVLETQIILLKEKDARQLEIISEKQGRVNEFSRIYGEILNKVPSELDTIVEKLDAVITTGEKAGGSISNLSSIKGFQITKPDSITFENEIKSLSELMSIFSDHTQQLEDLRQAGIDTTSILSYEWKVFTENIKQYYGEESETFVAVLNMKKDAETEYLNWRKEQWIEQNEFQNETLQIGLNSYKQFVTSMVDTDMTGKERREMIWESIKSGFINLLANMTAKMIENYIINASIAKAGEAAAITSAAVTSKVIGSSWSTAAAMASLATLGANSIPASAGMTTTVSLAKALAIGGGLNKGGEVLQGSDKDKDSVLTFLTKKEIVINRDSSQGNEGENRSILLGLNKDKDFIRKNFIRRNTGGAINTSEPKMNFPSMNSFPSRMEITSKQLESILSAVQAQTINQQKNMSSPVIYISSELDLEKFTIKIDEKRNDMEKRGYQSNE